MSRQGSRGSTEWRGLLKLPSETPVGPFIAVRFYYGSYYGALSLVTPCETWSSINHVQVRREVTYM